MADRHLGEFRAKNNRVRVAAMLEAKSTAWAVYDAAGKLCGMVIIVVALVLLAVGCKP
jgi:hypothetical protein